MTKILPEQITILELNEDDKEAVRFNPPQDDMVLEQLAESLLRVESEITAFA